MYQQINEPFFIIHPNSDNCFYPWVEFKNTYEKDFEDFDNADP
ncbi:hypothetical protein SAMN05444267_10816 [Chryseobacterium polytrichastri]|uniref:Uncharacterized protein n=1 Tax=Chryseobacterium polytrichastri TaxID=1302687 RepID=A0A1M7L3E7_9FLAO|nr:hypothetical protein SAMN05444267_10816 [Chryseobacterium polytrichastri]